MALRLKLVLAGAVALAAVTLGAAPSMAQQGPAVDTVTVWGQLEESLAADLAEYGARVEIVTEEQIVNGGFVDASQALQMLVPGLYVAPKNGAFDYVSVSLLGGRRQDVIWLIDGVRISNRLYTTTTPLDTIPAHMIEKIEVLKGGQSLFYGTSAVAGAINIVTRGFSEETEGSFGVGANTNEGRSIYGHTSGALGDSRYVLYASHDQADGIQPYRDEDYQPSSTDRNRGYDVTTFGLKYGYDFSDALKVSTNYQHTDAKLDFAGAEDVAVSFNDRNEDILSAKVDWSPADRFDFFVKGYYHWWTTHFTRLDNNLASPGSLTIVNNNEFWGFEDYGINALGQYALSDSITLLGGVDYQNYNGRDQVFLIAEQTEYVTAPFAQVRWDVDVLSGLKLAAGVRHNIPKSDSTTTVWNVSGDLAINDQFYVRGMAGTAFRLPDAYELYVNDPCCEQGNPNLKGETSENYELGVGGEFDRFNWELTGFSRKLDDLIQIVTVPDPRTPNPTDVYDTFDNAGTQVEVIGAELVMTAQLSDAVRGTFDWTHTEAEFEGSGLQVQDIPQDTAKFIVDWDPADRQFGAGLAVNYVGKIYDMVGGGVGRIEHGDYVVADLNARWYLDGDRKQRIGVRVENLFDEEYATSILRVRRDTNSASSYGAANLGTGQTFHINYTVGF
ncbi:MAG: TonB-dependent receptor [Alphaproteobacteria bacterium]|nr:TonB-dependent receptor [Alphaproteobacteria bacterium]